VLHLIAAAHSAGVKLGIEDFVRIGKKTPVLADLRPSGKYFMNDLVKIGGTVPLIRMLVNEGLMNGDCLTVTGKTMKENMKNSKIVWPKSQTDRAPAQQSDQEKTATSSSSKATSAPMAPSARSPARKASSSKAKPSSSSPKKPRCKPS
jgi:dihydroxyacid dehydratase/phosphogluconate dehydratase